MPNMLEMVSGRQAWIWGRNAVLGTSLEELYAYDQALDWNTIQDTAYALDLSSSSAQDGPAGTGARSVRVVGLDANFAVQFRDYGLNGQTKVDGTVAPNTTTFRRVFGAEILECGSGGVNAGDIHIVKVGTGGTYTGGAPGTLTSALCKILVGYGASMNGIFTTPAGTTWRIKSLVASTRAQTASIYIYIRNLSRKTATVLAPVASPGIVTWTGHGFVDNDAVQFSTTGALPTGITAGTSYYVKKIDADTFYLVTAPNVTTLVNFTGTPSGVHTGIEPVQPLRVVGPFELNTNFPLVINFDKDIAGVGGNMDIQEKTDVLVRGLGGGASAITSARLVLERA